MGRGWHHGKRVGCEGTQLLYRASALDLKSSGLPRLPLIASPYARALETAGIIAEQLNVPITVDPLITERFSSLATSVHPWPSFVSGGRIWHSIICRIHGGPRRRKRRRLSGIGPGASVYGSPVGHGRNRSGQSLGLYPRADRLKVPNAAVLRIDPTPPRRKPELLFVPGAG